ncbi:MAG: EamA family transporter [Acutalibacteraceae bacterium]
MTKYYFFILITAFASAVSQILLNISSKKEYPSKIREYLNPWVITSYAILAATLIANIYIMKFIPLKIAHAIAATTYIFVAIMSRIIFKEKIGKKKLAGLLLIIGGVAIFSL